MTRAARSLLPFGPVLAAVAAMASFQVGAAFAKMLFPALGPEGAATLRLGLGAGILILVTRPWRGWRRQLAWLPMLGLGAAMGSVIVMFYLALERLPLGLAMALQFLGPLAIAVFGSRRAGDLLWAALAGLGIWILLRPGSAVASADPVGVAWALGAAAAWGSYILLGRAASRSFGRSTAACALTTAALFVLPLGVHTAGSALLSPALLPLALLMALFSSAIPFSLEFYALPRVPPRTFAVLTSLEPAFGVVAGLFMLGESLSAAQVGAIGLVIAGAAGAAWSSAGASVPAPEPEAALAAADRDG